MKKLRLVVVSFAAGVVCALAAVAAATTPGALSRVLSPEAKASVETCAPRELATLRRSAASLRAEVQRGLAGAGAVAGPAAKLEALQKRLAACD